MKRKTDNFEKFYNRKSNSAIKEGIKQDKKREKKEKRASYDRYYEEKRKQREAGAQDQRPLQPAAPSEKKGSFADTHYGKAASRKDEVMSRQLKLEKAGGQMGSGSAGKGDKKNFPGKKSDAPSWQKDKNSNGKKPEGSSWQKDKNSTGKKPEAPGWHKADKEKIFEGKNGLVPAKPRDDRSATGYVPAKPKQFQKASGAEPVKTNETEGSGPGHTNLKEKHQFTGAAPAKPKEVKSKQTHGAAADDASRIPLNKDVAHAGLSSRRAAADLVKEGKVTVNGALVTDPGTRVLLTDTVKVNGKKITVSSHFVYILLNKPKDFLTTTSDPQGRKTVLQLIARATDERVYPIGRLDRNTSGVLIFTNDGDLAQKLSHPKNEVKKIYHVSLDKPLTKQDIERIAGGLELEDGPVRVDEIAYADPKDKSQIGVEIHSGKNRIVRRIFESLGYDVKNLDRVTYAGLTKKNVPRGTWRFLTEKEIRTLKYLLK